MNEIIKEINIILKNIVSEYRLKHIMGVVYTAKILANKNNISEKKSEIAALGHDLFRDVKPYKLIRISKAYEIDISYIEERNPILLHGKIAAEFLRRKFKIKKDIYDAIYYHTSGYKYFDTLGKIIFISDSIEPTRKYENVEYFRNLAFYDLNKAYIEILKNKIIYALKKEHLLLPDTIDAWNYTKIINFNK